MFAVIVNTITVLIGSTVGLLFKKGIPKRLTDAVMLGIGQCTLYIGISGTLKGENTIVLILSMVLGAIIGTALDIDGAINRLGNWIERKFSRQGEKVSVAQGFVTACLLFCVGAMTIVGSLNAGLTGDYEMLLTKSVLDLISSSMLAVSLGIGVMFAAVFVFVFQGALVLLAGFLQPLLTAAAINEIICAGSLLIVGLGLNLMGITRIKVADYLPAIIIAPILCAIIQAVPALAAFFG
ncbi:MAG: DUF554 domain-containing protein [Clostridia bacterium]|nr:DUF554 domain-containing protein [Clostridia bacterium]